MDYINGKFYQIGDIVKIDDGIMYKIIGFTELKIKANVLIVAYSREAADVEINDALYFIGQVMYRIAKTKVMEKMYPKYLPPLPKRLEGINEQLAELLKDNPKNIDFKIYIEKYGLEKNGLKK